MLTQLWSRFDAKARQCGLQLEMEIPVNVRYLNCDPNALSRVVQCLIDNAIKFSHRGKVLVRLIVNDDREPISVVVIDQGIGIEGIYFDKIFEPFFQIDQEITRKYEGLGLGLTSARRLCNGLGYSLEIDSQLNYGSKFTVHLASPRSLW